MDKELSIIIGKRIEKLLSEQNQRQLDLGDALGVHHNTISYFVSGSRIPNTAQIVKIAKFFNVSSDYILGLSDAHENCCNKTNEHGPNLISSISNHTGLNKKAIAILNNHPELSTYLNSTIPYFEKLIKQ